MDQLFDANNNPIIRFDNNGLPNFTIVQRNEDLRPVRRQLFPNEEVNVEEGSINYRNTIPPTRNQRII